MIGHVFQLELHVIIGGNKEVSERLLRHPNPNPKIEDK